MSSGRVFTADELKELNERENIHLLIHGKVYAISEFLDEHPGGDEVLFNEAGKDATEAFEDVGHSDESRELLEKYEVGTFQGKLSKGPSAEDAGAAPTSTKTVKQSKTDYSFLLPLAVLAAWLAYRYFDKTS